MKVNEIQIGDWVKPIGSYEGVYAKITSITPNRIDMVTTSGNPHHETADYISAIPLTAEILKKNGWVRTKYGYGRDCMEIHGADKLPEGVDNALSMARWSIDKNYQYHFLDLYMWKGSVMQHNVHYVHQLQHAFRIFGIEREIKL